MLKYIQLKGHFEMEQHYLLAKKLWAYMDTEKYHESI